MLAETVGVTLLEPLLAALPKPLQRLRVGPLAAPGKYTARDWLITNILCHWTGFFYTALAWKNLAMCGWSRDAFPWNLDNYPTNDRSCDDVPQTMWESLIYFLVQDGSIPALIGLIASTAVLIIAPCLMLRLARKLPGWSEPPAEEAAAEAAAEASSAALPPAVAKV